MKMQYLIGVFRTLATLHTIFFFMKYMMHIRLSQYEKKLSNQKSTFGPGLVLIKTSLQFEYDEKFENLFMKDSSSDA